MPPGYWLGMCVLSRLSTSQDRDTEAAVGNNLKVAPTILLHFSAYGFADNDPHAHTLLKRLSLDLPNLSLNLLPSSSSFSAAAGDSDATEVIIRSHHLNDSNRIHR